MKNTIVCFPDGKKKAFTMSFDDGVTWDEYLIQLMKKYGIRGSFHISTGMFGVCAPKGSSVYPHQKRLSQDEAAVLYPASGQEIAMHGYQHKRLSALSAYETQDEIYMDLKGHNSVFHVQPCGYSYPGGEITAEGIRVLRSCGIIYARTAESNYSYELPEDPMRWICTCHYADPRLPELLTQFLVGSPKDAPWIFSVWGHSYEFEMRGDKDRIEYLLDAVSGYSDIWYATPSEIFNYLLR